MTNVISIAAMGGAMNFKTSRVSFLLGSASLLTLAGASVSHAQVQEVVVTGSLIRGTEAVGVPVTSVGPEDFIESGVLQTADLLKQIPGFEVSAGAVGTNNGGNIARENTVNLRGLDSVGGYPVRSLLMVDGIRIPANGEHSGQRDPSIIPALAIDRIDVLLNGASATYGSDAISGVLNVVLKRGYEGAVSQGRVVWADGKMQYQASQLWGETWDGGGITLTYEWSDHKQLKGSARSNFTTDLSLWGLDNRTPIASSIPATISTGSPSRSELLGLGCTRCYAVPSGAGADFNSSLNGGLGPLAPSSGAGVLDWAIVGASSNGGPTNPAAGTANEINPYLIGWYEPSQQRNAFVATVDQRIAEDVGFFNDVSFFGEGYYSNRRSRFLNLSNQSPASTQNLSVQVPTHNPYYPIGAPDNLVVNYNIGLEIRPFTHANSISSRFLLGLDASLPHDWFGRIYWSQTTEDVKTHTDAVNVNAASAALGNTIPGGPPQGSSPGVADWTKPDDIPYLNLFCDPRAYSCNSQATLDYITGERDTHVRSGFNEKGINLDGPLFSLPGGVVRAAVGATFTDQTYSYQFQESIRTETLLSPVLSEKRGNRAWAIFGQLNIPLVSEAMSFPLMEQLEIQPSWRHDDYSDVGGTSNTKVGFNWTVSRDVGLFLRGDWGTSFRAPSFAEQSALVGDVISAISLPGFGRSITLQCNPAPGSMADRMLNPGPGFTGWDGPCGGRNRGPGGIGTFSTGGVALKYGFRDYVNTRQSVLRPETSTNYTLTAEFVPTGFLSGLDIRATWFKVKIDNVLTQFGNPNNDRVNDPAYGFSFIIPTDIAKAGINVAGCSDNNTPETCPEFQAIAGGLLNDPQSPISPSLLNDVLWVNDGAIGNFGRLELQGIDYSGSYDYDSGDFGVWSAGITGTYYLHRKSQNFPSEADPNPAVVDDFHTDISPIGNFEQNGVTTSPRMRARGRLSWTDGTWTVVGFANYTGHYFNTQNEPPNVDDFPNYSGLMPEYYTFDLSIGYFTGDMPANDYLKNINIQLTSQNIMNNLSPFCYCINAGQPDTGFDSSVNNLGRTIGLAVTKVW